jgi:hypothetical protein
MATAAPRHRAVVSRLAIGFTARGRCGRPASPCLHRRGRPEGLQHVDNRVRAPQTSPAPTTPPLSGSPDLATGHASSLYFPSNPTLSLSQSRSLCRHWDIRVEPRRSVDGNDGLRSRGWTRNRRRRSSREIHISSRRGRPLSCSPGSKLASP